MIFLLIISIIAKSRLIFFLYSTENTVTTVMHVSFSVIPLLILLYYCLAAHAVSMERKGITVVYRYAYTCVLSLLCFPYCRSKDPPHIYIRLVSYNSSNMSLTNIKYFNQKNSKYIFHAMFINFHAYAFYGI